MRKKVVVCLLAATMVTGVITGCGDSKTDSKPATEVTTETKQEELTKDMSEYSEIEWPDTAITKLIPKPKSMVGKIALETDDTIMADIANTSNEDYDEYVEKCKEIGYTEDYVTMDGMYTASNNNGYEIVLTLKDDHVMSITACESDTTVGDAVK